ncbi:MAG: transglutaminase domain-containing protein [Actinobacteria bacterium]|nr:transglutaminase domain-containing protein [Actinomycetota bacterium]
MRGRPGRGVDATLASVATLTAAWPISTLLAEPTWLRGTVLLLAVIALSGISARSLALRGWQVLMVQLVCSVLAAGAIYGRGHLQQGLPTFETLGFADRLFREALATAQSSPAPAPTTPGLIFVVGCAIGLIALAVDYLAVTRRSPSLAGLPLLTAFMASAANSGSSLPVRFFLAAAAMWLILIARAGSRVLRRWGTAVTVARTPAPQNLDSRGLYDHASTARMVGVVALVAAVAVPVVLPQPAPKFLASGLGRSLSAIGNASGPTGFSLSLDLAADLRNRSKATVLQYTTTDTSPPPLRVSVGSYYRSWPGAWLPWGRPSPALSTDQDVPEPTGLSPDVPKEAFVTDFRRNLLDDPYLAAPYPLIHADLAKTAWAADYQTQTVRVSQRPESYRTSYWRLEPTATMLANAPSLNDRDRYLFDLDLTLDGPYVEKVTALTERLTSDKTSAYDKAMAIQQYLGADGGFTYSLTLAPPAKDQAGNDAGLDPLTNFLVTKKGYCVQFATAMVMMSRAAGIPARMAIGFLPGTRAKDIWTVTASDAHAWPELYLDGIGWTRFEPTPSRGTPPAYAIPATSPGTALDGRPLDEATATPRRGTARKDLGASSTGTGTGQEVGLSPTSVLRWLTHGWGAVLLGALTGLFGTLVVPTAALWRRRRSLSTAGNAAQWTEVQWELLTSSLGDLGIAPSPSSTPRQLRTYYDREAFLEGEASQALGRVLQTLERSRYAVSPPPPDGLSADARQVLRATAATRRGRDRLRAALWPSSGIAQLRSARAVFAWRIRAPLRDVSNVVRQRFPHRHAGGNDQATPR